MPIYEYTCDRCEKDFEVLVRGEERPSCPVCGNVRVTKQLSVPAAHTAGTSDLPVCRAPLGGCRPECGSGGCAWE